MLKTKKQRQAIDRAAVKCWCGNVAGVGQTLCGRHRENEEPEAEGLTDSQEENISQMHHSAVEVLLQSYNCMREGRAGREWLLKARHANERITMMLDRLEKD